MADENNDETTATETDIFKQQEQTINLLYDVLQTKMNQPPAVTYVTAKPETATKATPNYLLYGGMALIAYLLLR